MQVEQVWSCDVKVTVVDSFSSAQRSLQVNTSITAADDSPPFTVALGTALQLSAPDADTRAWLPWAKSPFVPSGATYTWVSPFEPEALPDAPSTLRYGTAFAIPLATLLAPSRGVGVSFASGGVPSS